MRLPTCFEINCTYDQQTKLGSNLKTNKQIENANYTLRFCSRNSSSISYLPQPSTELGCKTNQLCNTWPAQCQYVCWEKGKVAKLIPQLVSAHKSVHTCFYPLPKIVTFNAFVPISHLVAFRFYWIVLVCFAIAI